MIKIVFTFSMMLFAVTLWSQHSITLYFTVPGPLVANAGDDVTIDLGDSIQIGGWPAGTGGNGYLTYAWGPFSGIDNYWESNPVVKPRFTTAYNLTVVDYLDCYVEDTVTVTVNRESIIPITKTTVASVPNPSDGHFKIAWDNPVPEEDYTVTIINTMGMMLYTSKMKTKDGYLEGFDLTNSPKGLYRVIIQSQTQVKTINVVIL